MLEQLGASGKRIKIPFRGFPACCLGAAMARRRRHERHADDVMQNAAPPQFKSVAVKILPDMAMSTLVHSYLTISGEKGFVGTVVEDVGKQCRRNDLGS